MSSIKTLAPPVANDRDLSRLLKILEQEESYALDTEFIGEGRYTPQLALIQIAWRKGVATIDPLEVDLQQLGNFFNNGGMAIMHSGVQDIKILRNYCRHTPGRVFDTQIAGGFLGMGNPNLGELVQAYVGIKLPKDARLTNWLRRPLSRYQIQYAHADVEYLFPIYDSLVNALDERGRISWVEQECENSRAASLKQTSPEDAWQSIKRAKSLTGRSLNLLQELAMWRELKARSENLPRQRIMSDMGVFTIAQAMPASAEEARGLRGTAGSFLKKRELLNEVLAIVSNCRNSSKINSKIPSQVENKIKKARKGEKIKNRSIFSLLLAWLNAYARDLEIYPPLLATQNDLIDFLSDPSEGRLSKGWRAELVAEPLRKIQNGEASIALDKDKNLVLEERSAKALSL